MIQILVADSSAVVRSVLKEIISRTKKLQWVGEAASFSELEDALERLRADFIITDKQFFAKEKNIRDFYGSTNIPSIFFYRKGDKDNPRIKCIRFIEMPEFIKFSSQKIKEYALFLEQQVYDIKSSVLFQNHIGASPVTINADGTISMPLKELSQSYFGHTFKAVLVGVSTGGPSTLAELIKGIGKHFPLPIFITQHIDSFFDKNLITWLSAETSVPVHLAENNMKPLAGHVYFAPSDEHLTFEPNADGDFDIALSNEPPVNFLRPAVDKMFESAADVMGGNCIAVVLTGMGSDGAKGCLQLKNLGAYTITQDEASCVIYGMPKAVCEIGGSCEELPLNQIAERLWSLVKTGAGAVAANYGKGVVNE